MTLILTEISNFGIAMAADSAVTFSRRRVYVGAQKLLPVRTINAGVSIWGRGSIGNKPADEWMQNFINNEVDKQMKLWDMASLLADELNQAFCGVIDDRMGIHVAGFDEKNGIRGPAFYHVHNGHYHIEFVNGKIDIVPEEYPPIREFRAHEDHPPKKLNENYFYIIRNGDFSIFSILFDKVSPLLSNLYSMAGLIFPYPENLSARGEYLRFWIKTISEIYRLSNARLRILPQPEYSGDASIGGPVTVLTISDKGIESFYTR